MLIGISFALTSNVVIPGAGFLGPIFDDVPNVEKFTNPTLFTLLSEISTLCTALYVAQFFAAFVAAVSTYVLVVNWVPDDGVCVLVGRLVLKVLVPVHALVPDSKLDVAVVIEPSTYVFGVR